MRNNREIVVRKFLFNNKDVWNVLKRGESIYSFDNKEDAITKAKFIRKHLKRNRRKMKKIRQKAGFEDLK